MTGEPGRLVDLVAFADPPADSPPPLLPSTPCGPEEEFWLPVGEHALWVVVHQPAGAPRAGVVLCSPFATEKVKAHRTLVACARHLAHQGFRVVRFDHRGEGDATGDFAGFGLLDRLADVDAVLAWLQASGCPQLGGVGVRLGATLLAAAAARRVHHGGEPLPLSLWAPIPDVAHYLTEQLRSNVLEQGRRHGRVLRERPELLAALARGEEVPVDGFPYSGRLLTEAPGLELTTSLAGWPGPLQLLEPTPRPAPVPEHPGLPAATPVRCKSRFWQEFRYHQPWEPELFTRTATFLESCSCSTRLPIDPARDGCRPDDSFLLPPSSQLAPGGLREEPFHVRDGQGQLLRGILTVPDRPGPLGLVLLPSGLLPRYGYHRHHVKGARILAAAGITVLRIDLPGLGDAAGELPPGPVEERWLAIQQGSYVEAALRVVGELRRTRGLAGVALGGACGGAATALLAAACAPAEVEGCLAISLPVCLSVASRPATAAPESSAPAPDAPRPLHPRQAELLAWQYLRKLGSPRAWWRLLTGQSEVTELRAALSGAVRRWLGRAASRLERRGATIPDDGRFNPRILAALRTVTDQRLPLRIVMGELDPDTDDFHTYLARPILDREPRLRQRLELELHPLVDHTFADLAAEQRLWQRTATWLNGPVRHRAAGRADHSAVPGPAPPLAGDPR